MKFKLTNSKSTTASTRKLRLLHLMMILMVLLTLSTKFIVRAQDDEDEDEINNDEPPTLLDNPSFEFLGTTSWAAIWLVFSIIYGVTVAGIFFLLWKWLFDVLAWIEAP